MDLQAKKMSPATIATLSKYEDRFRRALDGEKIALSSVGIKELESAYLEIYGKRTSLVQCCSGSRNISSRIAPVAKAYFAQINGSAKDTTALLENVEKAISKPIKVKSKKSDTTDSND